MSDSIEFDAPAVADLVVHRKLPRHQSYLTGRATTASFTGGLASGGNSPTHSESAEEEEEEKKKTNSEISTEEEAGFGCDGSDCHSDDCDNDVNRGGGRDMSAAFDHREKRDQIVRDQRVPVGENRVGDYGVRQPVSQSVATGFKAAGDLPLSNHTLVDRLPSDSTSCSHRKESQERDTKALNAHCTDSCGARSCLALDFLSVAAGGAFQRKKR